MNSDFVVTVPDPLFKRSVAMQLSQQPCVVCKRNITINGIVWRSLKQVPGEHQNITEMSHYLIACYV
jgi:hypothetical protein